MVYSVQLRAGHCLRVPALTFGVTSVRRTGIVPIQSGWPYSHRGRIVRIVVEGRLRLTGRTSVVATPRHYRRDPRTPHAPTLERIASSTPSSTAVAKRRWKVDPAGASVHGSRGGGRRRSDLSSRLTEPRN